MTRLPEDLFFENDEDGQCGNEDGQWLIRDPNTDSNDIVAVVQKTGDEQYDNDVTEPLARLLASAPALFVALKSAVGFAVDFRQRHPDDWREFEDVGKLLSVATAAIAKATT